MGEKSCVQHSRAWQNKNSCVQLSAWWRIFSDMRGPAENEPDTNKAKNDSYLFQTESKCKLFDGVAFSPLSATERNWNGNSRHANKVHVHTKTSNDIQDLKIIVILSAETHSRTTCKNYIVSKLVAILKTNAQSGLAMSTKLASGDVYSETSGARRKGGS